MEKLKEICLSVFFVFTLTMLSAQDVHFSQAIYSPLTLNPALAGINSPITAIVNYRTQWKSVASPYSTIAASFDMRINENRRQRKGIFAFGVNFLNDKAGDARISTTNVNLSLAYHLIVNRRSTIGLGIYSGFGSALLMLPLVNGEVSMMGTHIIQVYLAEKLFCLINLLSWMWEQVLRTLLRILKNT